MRGFLTVPLRPAFDFYSPLGAPAAALHKGGDLAKERWIDLCVGKTGVHGQQRAEEIQRRGRCLNAIQKFHQAFGIAMSRMA